MCVCVCFDKPKQPADSGAISERHRSHLGDYPLLLSKKFPPSPGVQLRSSENHFCFAQNVTLYGILHESWQPSQKITSNLPQSSLIMIQICPTIDQRCHEFSKSALSGQPAAVKGKAVMSKLWNSSWHVLFAPLWSCLCAALPTSHSSGPFSEQHI